LTTSSSPSTLTIDAISLVHGPALEISGFGAPPEKLSLVGARLTLPGSLRVDGAGAESSRWTATVPLLVSRWGGAALAPPSGSYRLTVGASDPEPVHALDATLPETQLVPALFRIAFRVDEDRVTVVFTAPLTEDEHGAANQQRLEAQYRAERAEPLNAVFFESFYGHNASCNPLALDRAFATARPDVVRYWGVADASVAIPDGAIPLVEGSAEWWRIRAGARLIVINDWLRNRYKSRPHQTVLQTWHGTMLKKLALSRSKTGLRPALATLRERSRWDILLAQNDYAKRIFRRAYAYFCPIWEEGYPRDDVLVTGDRSAIRTRLGIPDGVRVLLYAPTWRDDRPDHIDHLDVANFTKQLGPDFVTLIRGHSRTIEPGQDLHANGVIDVTSYPDISELFLAADVLITDYSSVMFDFSVTGKPIFFFTPDLDRYREVLRGFYFDLLPAAPGPVVQDPAELLSLVRQPESIQGEYAAKYAAWRERFNPRDDGHAAERVVARLIREGKI
jgi:CDP-glycerol glycerophosphotransferase